jgi:response regulator NasT
MTFMAGVAEMSGEQPPVPHGAAADPFEIGRLRLQNEQLRIELTQTLAAMAGREVIEQAKGLLMGYYRCDPEQAFEVLRELSQRANVKLRQVAVELVELASREGRVHYRGIDAVAETLIGQHRSAPATGSNDERPAGWR